MTTFEEEFPSLKGFADMDVTPEFIMVRNGIKAESYYGESKLLEHCIDKAKVKDAINRVRIIAGPHLDCIRVEELLEELNL